MVATLQASNLTKVYALGDEQVFALNNVSLEVGAGEMVAVLGEDGAGKSTLLHVLGCLQRPDSGQLRIEHLDMSSLGDQELGRVRVNRVGFMYQAFNLMPNESVLANVEIALRHQGEGLSERQRKAAQALKVVGLEDRLEHKPGQLSPTQRQCVAIARALAHGPAAIFSDEPTRVLDNESTEGVMGLFQKINGAGMTIVIATPDPNVANYCSRVVRMSKGKLAGRSSVPKRRVVPSERVPGTAPPSYVREEEKVCPRCLHGNPKDEEVCRQCNFSLHLTEEEERTIEGRLTRAERAGTGVESATDEGYVPGEALIKLVKELKDVPFFAELGSKNLLKILPVLESLRFSEGSVIVKQGDEGDSFYTVKKGNVQVVLERPGKAGIPIAQLGPNEAFGEMALLTGLHRSATVIALTDVEVWCLPKARFEELVTENVSLSLYFSRLLTQRLVSLQEKIIL